MATATLANALPTFPAGTVVGAYPLSGERQNREPDPGQAPLGAATTTATVASDGSLAFTGLAEGTLYAAGAQVNSAWAYRQFRSSGGETAHFEVQANKNQTDGYAGLPSSLTDGGVVVWDGAISTATITDVEPYALPLYRWPAIYEGVTFDHAAIALDFDDGPTNDSAVVGPALKSRGLIAGFGLVSGLLNTTGFVTTAQAQQLQADGNEIKCHSATHTDISLVSGLANQWTTFVNETQAAQTALQALGFFADAFTEPGPWTGLWLFDSDAKFAGRAGRLVRRLFAAYCGYISQANISSGMSMPMPAMRRYGASRQAIDTTALATIEGYVDNLVSYGGGMILNLHSSSLDGGGKLSTTDFTALLDYIVAKRDAGLLNVLTPTGLLYAKQRSAGKVNLLSDANLAQSATGALRGSWSAASGSPTVVPWGRTYNALQVNTSNNAYLQLSIRSGTARDSPFRTGIMEIWAKTATAGSTAKAQVNVKAIDTNGVVQYSSIPDSGSVTVGDTWTKIRLPFSSHPDSRFIRVLLTQAAGSASDVLYSDPLLYKT